MGPVPFCWGEGKECSLLSTPADRTALMNTQSWRRVAQSQAGWARCAISSCKQKRLIMFEGFGLIEEGTDWKEWHQRDRNMCIGLFGKTAPGSFPSWNMFQLFMVLRGGKYSVINKWELISWRDSVWVGRSLLLLNVWISFFRAGQEFGSVSADGCLSVGKCSASCPGMSRDSELHVSAYHQLSLRPRRAWKI